MIKIGLTGGIGSGKTVVAQLLELKGVPVYIADEESKLLVESSPVIREKLIRLLGDSLYTPEGLDKKKLAGYIFNDPGLLQAVNEIIHPEVQQHFLQWVSRQQADCCVIESAILFESGFDRIVDVRLMVYAPMEIRIERVMQRSRFTREEVELRIQSQLADEVKKEQSDYTILNDNIHALIPQIEGFLSAILPV